MKLGEIAQRLGCELEGTGDIDITGVRGLDEAGSADLSFVSTRKYISKIKTTRAAALILGRDLPKQEQPVLRPILRSKDPYTTFARALELFYQPPRPAPGIHPTAVVAPTAKLGRNTSIGPYVVIEDDVEIGDDAVLKSFVVIYQGARIGHRFLAHSHAVVREFCRLGDDVILQNGAVVGCDGYGFAKQPDGSYYKIVAAGNTVLEDRVEIQANACLDRATVGETRIRAGAKIDNLVQVGHSSEVGENSLLCAQVGLAGSTRVGRSCILTGQVGVAGHCTLGDNVVATAQSGIPNDVPSGKIVSGYPAIDNKLWLKCSVAFTRLPDMVRAFRKYKSNSAQQETETKLS